MPPGVDARQASAVATTREPILLGGVDGFDQDEAGGERDDGGEVPLCFLAAQGDALEALELADGLLDASATPVKRLGEETRFRFLVGLVRDDRDDAALASRRPVGLAGIALVADSSPRIGVGAKAKKDREVRCVAFLPAGQVESDGMPVEVGLQMDLGGEAAARSAERVPRLPPFAPAAETWARTTVESNICTRCAEDESEAR